MATTTLGAIVALFDADAALTEAFAGSGGLWVGGVPEDRLALPQCVIEGFREVPSWDFESAVIEDEGDFAFAVYAAELGPAEALAGLVKAVFDPQRPAADGSGGGSADLTGMRRSSPAAASAADMIRQDAHVSHIAYRTHNRYWNF